MVCLEAWGDEGEGGVDEESGDGDEGEGWDVVECGGDEGELLVLRHIGIDVWIRFSFCC